MAYQTTFSNDPAIAIAGMPADSTPRVTESFVAEGAPVVGLLCQRGTDRERQVIPMTSAVADVDSIVDATPGIASAATEQTITSASADGVIGAGLIIPAQQLTATLNNHADWDATSSIFTYEDVDGKIVRETVLIPNGGNQTITTLGAARRFISWYIPAQTGTNGTATIGTAPTAPVLSLRDFPGVAMFDASRMPYTTGNAYTDKDECPVIAKGRAYVTVEDAVTAGDPVYVRTTTSGADVAGQFGGEKASNFGALAGARYVTSASTDGLAIVELG
jgi:hypothetical protein